MRLRTSRRTFHMEQNVHEKRGDDVDSECGKRTPSPLGCALEPE